MTERLTIAIAQCNPVVGDIAGNIGRIREIMAGCQGVDLIVFSELVVSGYPPEDLVLKPFFQDKVEAAVEALAKDTGGGGPALLVTAPWRENGKVYNTVLLLDGGKVAAKRFKHDLPNYGVFDEKRVFATGPLPGPVNFRDVRLGVPICEDIWTPDVAGESAHRKREEKRWDQATRDYEDKKAARRRWKARRRAHPQLRLR